MDSKELWRTRGRTWECSWSLLRLTAMAALLSSIAGCRGPAPVDMTSSAASGDGDWYCEPAGLSGWQCASEDSVRTTAQPPRQALVPEPQPAPSEPKAPPAPALATPRPPPAAPRPAPAELPLYRELAHQIDGASLLELPSTYYALQLFAATSAERVEEVAAERGLHGMAGARVDRDGQIFYVLLAGVYPTREAAEQAQASLPASVRAMQPWVRRMGGLQAAMRRAAAAPQ